MIFCPIMVLISGLWRSLKTPEVKGSKISHNSWSQHRDLCIHTLCDIKVKMAYFSRCTRGIKVGMNKLLFAARPISLKSKARELGHQLSGEARYTYGTALRTPPAAASLYAQRGEAALGSCFGVALGWEARAARLGLGEKRRRESWYAATTTPRQENQPTAAAAAHMLLLLLCCALVAVDTWQHLWLGLKNSREGHRSTLQQ